MPRRLAAALALAVSATLAAAPTRAAAPPAALPPALPPAAADSAAGLTRVALVPGRAVRAAVPAGVGLAGVTWSAGAPEVAARVLSGSGWSPWQALDADDAPEARRPGTEPLWLPRGTLAVEVRVDGAAPGAQLELVSPPRTASAPAEQWHPRLGSVVTRAGWGADESMRRRTPSAVSRVDAVVVHHTVTPNEYSPEEAAAYVRAVYAYHTRSRRYDDIAYNLLVDRFGRVYEGRSGSLARAVVGAHTSGFNRGTLGVALLGNFDVVAVPDEALARVAGAVAWAADRWKFDPRTKVALHGSRRVTADRVSPHQAFSATACPGQYVVPALPAVRSTAWRLMAALFLDVRVAGAPVRAPGPIRISARLDHAAQWRAIVEGPLLNDKPLGIVAESSGSGTSAAVEWDGRSLGAPAVPGTYRYTLTADDGVHGPSEPVTGTFEVLPPV